MDGEVLHRNLILYDVYCEVLLEKEAGTPRSTFDLPNLAASHAKAYSSSELAITPYITQF